MGTKTVQKEEIETSIRVNVFAGTEKPRVVYLVKSAFYTIDVGGVSIFVRESEWVAFQSALFEAMDRPEDA